MVFTYISRLTSFFKQGCNPAVKRNYGGINEGLGGKGREGAERIPMIAIPHSAMLALLLTVPQQALPLGATVGHSETKNRQKWR